MEEKVILSWSRIRARRHAAHRSRTQEKGVSNTVVVPATAPGHLTTGLQRGELTPPDITRSPASRSPASAKAAARSRSPCRSARAVTILALARPIGCQEVLKRVDHQP
jgi:hypothetical protein